MNVWFSADQHFQHANIIRYSHRPFTNVAEMDERLVSNWNERVGPKDTVYHLGDLIFRATPQQAAELLSRLHGQICLVRGNHDAVAERHKERFTWIKDLAEIKIADAGAPDGWQRIVLCHYAMRVWNRSHYGTWSLFAHSHGSLPDDPHSLSLDVGVDVWNYAPVSYEEIKERMLHKQFVPVDHHGQKNEVE